MLGIVALIVLGSVISIMLCDFHHYGADYDRVAKLILEKASGELNAKHDPALKEQSHK